MSVMPSRLPRTHTANARIPASRTVDIDKTEQTGDGGQPDRATRSFFWTSRVSRSSPQASPHSLRYRPVQPFYATFLLAGLVTTFFFIAQTTGSGWATIMVAGLTATIVLGVISPLTALHKLSLTINAPPDSAVGEAISLDISLTGPASGIFFRVSGPWKSAKETKSDARTETDSSTENTQSSPHVGNTYQHFQLQKTRCKPQVTAGDNHPAKQGRKPATAKTASPSSPKNATLLAGRDTWFRRTTASALHEKSSWTATPVPATGTIILIPQARGILQSIAIEARCGTPLGLFHWSRRLTIELPRPLYVGPAPAPDTGTPILTGGSSAVTLQTASDLSENPAQTRGLRRYQPGDPLKQVHWAATARWNDIMVREFDTPARATTVLLVQLPPDDPAKAEEIASHAAGVALACLRNKIPPLLVTREANGPKSETVHDQSALNRRLAAALPGPLPEAPPHAPTMFILGQEQGPKKNHAEIRTGPG